MVLDKVLGSYFQSERNKSNIPDARQRFEHSLSVALWTFLANTPDRLTSKRYPKIRDPFEQAKDYVPRCYYMEEYRLRALPSSKKDRPSALSASEVNNIIRNI